MSSYLLYDFSFLWLLYAFLPEYVCSWFIADQVMLFSLQNMSACRNQIRDDLFCVDIVGNQHS